MTLGDGKRRVLMLLDEYSSGGELTEDPDILAKMSDFFDTAQKEMAGYKKILRSIEIEVPRGDGGIYYHPLPEDYAQTFRVWRDGRELGGFPVIKRHLAIPFKESGSLLFEYFALPTTITQETPDTYEFEVSEDAAVCLPFYVAAQHLIPDLVVDYSAFWQMYVNMRAALDTSLPIRGSRSYIRQALYTARR